MNSRLYRRVKEIIYLLTFVLSVVIKWTYNGIEGPFSFIVSNQIIYLPALLMICLMYFHYRHYHNIFIQTRFQSLSEVRKQHFRSNFLEAVQFLGWQLVIAVILGFHVFTLESFYALGIICISLFLLYIAYIMIYMTILEVTNYYYYAFCTCGILLIAYRIIIYNGLGLGAYTLSYDGIEQNYILIGAYLFIILCCIIFLKFYFWERKSLRVSKKMMAFIICVFTEILSEIFLMNQSLSPTSFTLNNYFGILQNNELFVILLWLLPKIILIYSTFVIFCERYRMNYIFYAVRIINKRKWVHRIMKELYIFITGVVVSKLLFHCLFYQVLSFSLIGVSIEYLLYIFSWLCILIVVYLIGKTESIFNYIMIIYIFVNSFVGIMKIYSLQWLLLNNNLINYLVFLVFIASAYCIIVYLMNHHEYY